VVQFSPAANATAQRYIARRSRNGGQFWWAGSVGASATVLPTTGPIDPFATYAFTVEAANGALRSEATVCTDAADGPIAPVGCEVSVLNNQPTVSWEPAVADGAIRYIVRRSRNGGQFWWAGSFFAPSTSAELTGLVNDNANFRFTVEAVNAAGVVSAPTAVCTDTPAADIYLSGDAVVDANGTCIVLDTNVGALGGTFLRTAIQRVSNGTWLLPDNATSAQAAAPRFSIPWYQTQLEYSQVPGAAGQLSSCVDNDPVALPAGDYFLGVRTFYPNGGGEGPSIWQRFTVA